MKLLTPEISYHNVQPIYSCDIQPKSQDFLRLATGGFDCRVILWKLEYNEENVKNSMPIEIVADLKRHEKRVNIVRWSPNGLTLASASDDGVIILWTKSNNTIVAEKSKFENDDDDYTSGLEVWNTQFLRRHIQDVYDLSWSLSGNQIISGSVDRCAMLWNLKHTHKSIMLKDHKQFIQGVAWDPLDHYVITQSNDRTFRVYRSKSRQCIYKVWKDGDSKLFYDGSWTYFFRRPEWSPDGLLLVTPAGICPKPDLSPEGLNVLGIGKDVISSIINGDRGYCHAAHIFVRHNLSKVAVTMPTGKYAVLGVRFNPVRYNLRGLAADAVFRIPYRWIFCLIIESGILIYDTEQAAPIFKITNIHCLSITDASWSPDGRCLVVSSTDGYCSYMYFEEGEFGALFAYDVKQSKRNYDRSTVEEKDEVSESNSGVQEMAEQTNKLSDELQNLREQSTKMIETDEVIVIDDEDDEDDEDDDDDDDEEEDIENASPPANLESPMDVDLMPPPTSMSTIAFPTVSSISRNDSKRKVSDITSDGNEEPDSLPAKKRRLSLTTLQ